MCHRPTQEETARSEARKALSSDDEVRRQPWTYPEPRGNQEPDREELERGTEKLVTVLGH